MMNTVRCVAKRVIACIVVILSLAALVACDMASTPATLNMLAFDTTVSVTLYGSFTQDKSRYLNECRAIIERYELILSCHNEESELFKLNTSCGGKMSTELAEVVAIGLDYSQKTDGAFDITLGALNNLWDVVSRKEPPTDTEVQSALAVCGYDKLHINGDTAVYDVDGLIVDLGGIAKGYVADKLRNYLLSMGITHGAVITLGGGICCIGDKTESGDTYKIGMQDPHSGGLQSDYLDVRDTSVTSSGNYERFFEYNGIRYCHIINSKTGYPVDESHAMVTVVCKDATLGDVLSTAIYVIGEDNAESLISHIGADVEDIVWTD